MIKKKRKFELQRITNHQKCNKFSFCKLFTVQLKLIYQTEPASIFSMNLNAIFIFLVNTPEANPYLVSFARLITSSNVLNLIIC